MTRAACSAKLETTHSHGDRRSPISAMFVDRRGMFLNIFCKKNTAAAAAAATVSTGAAFSARVQNTATPAAPASDRRRLLTQARHVRQIGNNKRRKPRTQPPPQLTRAVPWCHCERSNASDMKRPLVGVGSSRERLALSEVATMPGVRLSAGTSTCQPRVRVVSSMSPRLVPIRQKKSSDRGRGGGGSGEAPPLALLAPLLLLGGCGNLNEAAHDSFEL